MLRNASSDWHFCKAQAYKALYQQADLLRCFLNDRYTDQTCRPAVEILSSTVHYIAVIYVLAYPVIEPPLGERIIAFREKHEPQRAQLVPPHVTLVFGVEEKYLQAVIERVEHVARHTQTLRVTFDDTSIEFDPFERKYKIFLLCGEGGGEITALHNQLYEADYRIELSSSHPFRPHMTIATYDKSEDIEQVDVSDAGELPVYGRLRGLEIVKLANGQLTTLKTAPFLR